MFPTAVRIVLLLIAGLFIAFGVLSLFGVLDRAWWLSNAAAIGGHLLTVAGIVVGAQMILHQVNRGHEASLAVQREGKRNELQLIIYESLSSHATAVNEAILDVNSYLRRGGWSIDTHLRSRGRAGPLTEISQSAEVLVDLHGDAGKAISALIREVEKWEISIPRLDVFRFALISASHDTREDFNSLVPIAVRLLPRHDIGDNVKQIFYPAINEELFQQYEQHRLSFEEHANDLVSYVMDLRVEAQNQLVSGLFEGRRAPHRQPEDPSKIVVTTNEADYERLTRFFTIESAHGKLSQEAIASVREMLASRKN
ncbi:hypothetical protein [Lysobacter sp. CA199]|uniref:hypothetical protein n=1 Tax=Lysobacter sp. CA199 TaxID=3455608 RepID=UPI003F8D1F17